MRLNKLTEPELIELYVDKKNSLGDIAKLYGVSRTAIYKKLKKYGIKQRSKSKARLEAQKQGKLPQQFFDINEDFFSSWSPEMAYVLGLIITDSCVSKTGTVSLCLNDKDLLEKVKAAMGSNHKIEPSKYQERLYIFHFARENLEDNLTKLGMQKRKISHQKTKNGIYYGIRYGHENSLKLYTILYKNVQNGLFLERKYNRFLAGLKST
jgi:predicted DNA-binding protein YlxM (UPF0122 family)